MNDEQLMLEAHAGSREAFEALFERHRGPIWRFFRRRTRDAALAEELAQDTFVALLEAATRYEPRSTFRAYLFGIAYNILHAHRRTQAHQSGGSLDFDPVARSPDPTAAIWVRQALQRLDEEEREILMLREYEQLSYQDIADVRRLALNTVRSKLFRARMALRDALAADGSGVRTKS